MKTGLKTRTSLCNGTHWACESGPADLGRDLRCYSPSGDQWYGFINMEKHYIVDFNSDITMGYGMDDFLYIIKNDLGEISAKNYSDEMNSWSVD